MSNRVKPNFIVRELQLSDCEEVRKLWSEVDFVLSKYTNEVMINVDPKGLLVAQDLDSGNIIGVCNGINVSPELACIGQYGVKAEYQGRGVGVVIWQKIMEHIGPERNVALVSRITMWTKYRDRTGFGILADKQLLSFEGIPDLDNLIDSIDGISLQSINEDNIESVVKYDKSICDGIDRTALIRQFSRAKESANLVAINEKQEVLGYCVVMTTNTNIGIVEPLYAENEKIAELLIEKTLKLLPIIRVNGIIYFCWNTNPKAIAIAHKLGFNECKESPVLFTKKLIEGNMNSIYCVSNHCCYPF